MFKKILIVLVAIIAAFCIFVQTRPDHFSIERSATIEAPPAAVFAQVNDFHNWEAWSPWAKLDPDSKATYEGAESGKGAIFKWAGNSDVGEGSMTITESRPDDLILIDLHFIKPFEGTNVTEFTFKPVEDRTVVSWKMSGEQGFLHKAICLVMNMDKTVGGMFEQGLASMKAIVEKK
jgi:uncharacterized protein YndB with AHSA1/START domain